MYNVSSVKLNHKSPTVFPVGAVLLVVALAPEFAQLNAACAKELAVVICVFCQVSTP
jgi:hypothetical protein